MVSMDDRDPLTRLGFTASDMPEMPDDFASLKRPDGLRGDEVALGEEIRLFAEAHPGQPVYIVTETGAVAVNPGESLALVFDQLRAIGFDPSTIQLQEHPPEASQLILQGNIVSNNNLGEVIERMFEENPASSITTIVRLDELVTMYCGSRIWFAYTGYLDQVQNLPPNEVKEEILANVVEPLLEAGELASWVHKKAIEVLRDSGYSEARIKASYSEEEREKREEIGDPVSAAEDFYAATGIPFTEIETVEQLHQVVARAKGATWAVYVDFIKAHHALPQEVLKPRLETFIIPLLQNSETPFISQACRILIKHTFGDMEGK